MLNDRIPGRRLFEGVLLCGLLIVSGCASAPRSAQAPTPAAAPTPRPASPSNAETAGELLAPSPAALRAADRARLQGDELGRMWLFENPPLDYWKKAYDFVPDSTWLRHVRLASVRFGEICSASFVSPDGLVLTNHHCARECVAAVSPEHVDYVQDGFYAVNREDELTCPDLYLDQLVQIEDVTSRVRGALPTGVPDTVIAAARDSVETAIEKACKDETKLECQVVDLYHGGAYHLYRFRRYRPVKLVFAPELQAGAFGGDPDNFTYPRYDLDISFFRAYQVDSITPVSTPDYLRWNPDGAEEGDVVFVTGNPGSTNRLRTISQLMYLARYDDPFTVAMIQSFVDFLHYVVQQNPAAERHVREQEAEFQNALKSYRGELDGLRDTLLVGRKIRWERDFRARVQADGGLNRQYGDTWNRITEIEERLARIGTRHTIYDFDIIGDPHTQLAGDLVRWVRQRARPEEQRTLDDAALDSVYQTLTQPTPYDPDVGAHLLAIRLQLARDWLAPDDPVVRTAFRGDESALDVARRLIRGSRIADVAFRRTFMGGDAAALEQSSDPMIRLARVMASGFDTLDTRVTDLQARESAQEERLAQALFAVFGSDIPPDATFTLRITDGVVKRYPYNGTFAPAFTSFYGLYERAHNFNNEHPWDLPQRYVVRRDSLDLATRLNFVATTDIAGGNSGSPIVDEQGRLVGTAFDGNIESLPNDFLFTTEAARTVAVHSAGILEALRRIYRADRLVNEITRAMNLE
ncbi:MAG: S46 family peptidase [Gemmatimonadota bacterium]